MYGAEYKKLKIENSSSDNDLKMGARSDKIKASEVNIDRSDVIDGFTETDQILKNFPQINFNDKFSAMAFESQLEIAQGLNYMSERYGADILPRKIIVADDLGGDFARYNTQTKTMKFRKSLEPGMALISYLP